MPHRLLLFLAGLFSLLPMAGFAAEAKKLTVVDYFLQLPDKTFEAPNKEWLMFLRQKNSGVEDVANGYLSCTGDGAQPSFEVTLFRYQDGRPLLAVCQGELEGPPSRYLAFYEPGFGGRMHEVKRSIFPVPEEKGFRFDLPRHGRTVVVRDGKSGKIVRKLTWDGEKFAETK